jgi:fructose-1,6-bisphosphatase/inositol monophosphatase family enzyme
MLKLDESQINFLKQLILDASKKMIGARQNNDFNITFKNDNSPVTNIDKEIEVFLTKHLKEKFDYQVVGEEFEKTIDKSQPYWAIDPIDGTHAFINHENTSVINLSLIKGSEVLLGIVFNPVTNEFFISGGTNALLNDKTLPLIACKRTAAVNFKPVRNMDFEHHLLTLYKQGKIKKLVSLGGSITYSICMVAKGSYSNYITYFDEPANPWDLTAAAIILSNAGGLLTDMNGKEINPINHQGYIVASANKMVSEQFLKMIQQLIP